MVGKDKRPVEAADLRRQAEAIAREQAVQSPEQLEAMSPEDTRLTLHELQVHQIELEMQNEELRRAQAELDGARARYFDLYDLAPVGYCTLSEQGLILEANLTAATLLGVTRGARAPHPVFSRFIVQEDQDLYYQHRKKLLETGEPQALELRMVKMDGTAFWAQLEAGVAPDAEGARVCRVVLSNITGRKQADAEKERLETLNRQLQKSESLGRMAGAIAHHFNNQLQAVRGNLEMVLEALPRDVAAFESVTEAMLAAHKASEVSSLMLTYLGETLGTREPLDLSATCRENLPMLRAALPKRVVLKTDLPSPGPIISANANQMQQVLANLISNAWEAAGEGQSTVHLTVKTAAPPDRSAVHRFPIAWQPKDTAYAFLEVADQGCGIADEDIDSIFDPFFSSKFTGRGMGLAVLLGIVAAHGGAVTVASEPGGGSIFRVYLPLTAAAIPRPPQKVAAVPEIQGGGTVLLVEDEEMVRTVAARMLASLGLGVLVAKDGVEALEVFRQHRDEIRCVLCDLTMPRLGGWETLTALRKIAPGLPVILASGYSEEQVMEGRHLELPQAFLGKPYTSDELREVLGRALGRAWSGKERRRDMKDTHHDRQR